LILKKYNKNKYINITHILIPKNIKINNEQIFKQYVGKSIVNLIKIKHVKELLGNYIKESIDKNNVGFEPDFDKNYHLRIIDLDYLIQNSINNIKEYFQKNIFYIGPLREEPHLQYESRIDNAQNIGIKGENCAGVIYQNKKIKVMYINPKYFEHNNKIERNFCDLLDSVNEWLRYIGVADSVFVNFNGRYGYELKIKTINKVKGNDLTNVGVGVSQVLPIILECLLASEGTTIIIEQPELHLHPAMQSKLTDFFVATILCNKQLIIETHSEYIINRLRLRAINLLNEKPINNYIKIYFTENLQENYKNYKKGNTLFRPLEINEYAAMSDWPEGFFDESSKIADEIIKAAAKKWEENKDDKK
jgi:predicted ATPase